MLYEKKVQPHCSWKIINNTWKLLNCNSVISVKSEPLQKHERYWDVRKLFLRFSHHGFFSFLMTPYQRSCVCSTVTDSTLKDLASPYLHPTLNSGSGHPTKFTVFNVQKSNSPPQEHCLLLKLQKPHRKKTVWIQNYLYRFIESHWINWKKYGTSYRITFISFVFIWFLHWSPASVLNLNFLIFFFSMKNKLVFA